jgi:hypothetical protein
MKSNTFFTTKNQLPILFILALVTLPTLPHQAAALSCLNPAEMIEQYATGDTYTVALVQAGAVETVGDTHDQVITTKTLYKGALATTDTVAFSFNETWDYLCVGGPAKDGAQALYVLQDKQVVQVFTINSEFGQNLLAAITTPEVQPTEVSGEQVQKQNLMERIVLLLKQIISLLTPDTNGVILDPADTNKAPDYIGMNTIEAAAEAEARGVLFRIVELDGAVQMTIKDLTEGRINATVENGVVTAYSAETSNPIIEEIPLTEPGSHDAIIGMTPEEAQAYATTNDVDFRVGMIDGEALPVTMDYRVGRITAATKDNVVTSYTVE